MSLACIVFLLVVGLISYKFSNTYALFGNDIIGIKTINIEVAKPSAADTLISKVGTGGLEKITHSADSTLQIGATSDLTEYRYRGANPNNYVIFNNETWRIIGIFPTDDGTGKIENRVKLIRNESIGNAYWANDNDIVGLAIHDEDISVNNLIINGNENVRIQKLAPEPTAFYRNIWTSAILNTYLNNDYYNNLTSQALSMIDSTKYYLGGYLGSAGYADITKDEMYKHERKISGNDYYHPNNSTNDTNKIALMYVSDYGYAASDECSQNLNNYSTSACANNNWMYLLNIGWLISHNSFSASDVYFVSNGNVSSAAAKNLKPVNPVLYLKADVKINDGDGTADNPYTLI